MTEYQLFQALRPLYPPAAYALLPQVANGTGSRANRHADALALSLWPSRGLHLSGFEIKSYRSDWLQELKNPAKAEAIAQFCNYWWIVTAGDSIAKVHEVPEAWGLMSWDATTSKLKKVKPAKFHESTPLDLPMIAAILRKAQDVVTPSAVVAAAEKKAYKDGLEAGAAKSKYDHCDYEKLREVVKEFKKASGIDITDWHGGKEIGLAVRQVLHGEYASRRRSLIACAKHILETLGKEEECPAQPATE